MGALKYYDTTSGTWKYVMQGPKGDTGPQGPAGTGDVVGPASSATNRVALFDGTTGKLVKQSSHVSDDGSLLYAGDIEVVGGVVAPTVQSSTSVSTPLVNTGTISENTAAAGVTIDGVKIKDNELYLPNSSSIKSAGGDKIVSVYADTGATSNLDIYAGSGSVDIGVAGSAANINLNLWKKGTGKVRAANDGIYREVATTTGMQTLTNKTISIANNTISNPYKFSVARNSAANTGNGAFAKISFDTELYDTNNNFSSGTYTVPVAGYYMMSAGFAAASSATGQCIIVSIYKNGSEDKRLATSWSSDASQAHFVSGSLMMELAANDTIEIYAYGTVTFALDVSTAARPYFSGYLVSQT